jgi:cytochrome c-type biogenesis protein
MDISLAPAAFLSGVLMFLAPCTLPIVPGYLGFISGKNSRRVLINALAFVAGFSLIFILFGTAAGAVGMLIGPWRGLIARTGGLLIILFGLTMLGVVRLPVLASEHHLRLPKFLVIGRWQSSLLIGVLFALGWSPCIGPILGTVLFLAAHEATATSGAFLLSVFSLGLGLPFLLTALLLSRAQTFISNWGAVSRALSIIGGCVLLVVGTLMILGDMGLFVSWGFTFLRGPYDQLLKYM